MTTKFKKSYRNIEQELIAYFFNKSAAELSSATKLNNSDETPYIKKRLKGSGGYRFYFLLIIKNDKLYLMFVHPKTGSLGAENITDESKAVLYKKVLEYIKTNNLYHLELDKTYTKIVFKKLQG